MTISQKMFRRRCINVRGRAKPDMELDLRSGDGDDETRM